MFRSTALASAALLALMAPPAQTQTADTPPPDTSDSAAQPADVASVDMDAMQTEDGLLTPAQLQTLVAPVALYPDSLLVQLLVASTYPLEVVKADRVVQHNAELEQDALQAEIEAQGFDPSVEVLAIAFPTVLAGMAEHIEWTEITGNAMLAQSDDVMDAVQVMRKQAINTGALATSEEQTVTVVEEELDATLSTQNPETVIIQPTNPQQVYVPTYDPNAVYGGNYYSPYYAGSGFRWQDAAVGAAVVYGTVALIDAIFDNNDDWNDYWGCRYCGGWNGRPIIRDPSIDFDGNIIIGNDINIDRDRIREGIRTGDIDRDRIRKGIEAGDIQIDRDKLQNIDRGKFDPGKRDEMRTNLENKGWKPDAGRQQEARNKISEKRQAGGATTLPAQARPDRGDELRQQVSKGLGTGDISRPGNSDALRDAAIAAGAAGGALAGREALKRSGERPDVKVNRPATTQKPAQRPQAGQGQVKQQVQQKQTTRPATSNTARQQIQQKSAGQKIQRPTGGTSRPAIKKQSGGARTKAASQRGHSGAKLKGRR
ncbi:DUF3300 domain-containing protein [Aliiruegeria sabulilitoris]|uniref:DUF3300 domain-containing protein n=1 Tax=Aliiruegeria sabulilitoris TaxID=1510458 RepID=UPI0008378A03|nr:DUF3300 domain-containing protein [Aliiruegeria sabulilitoris]